MANLSFDEVVNTTDKRQRKGWSYIEEVFPGAKDLLHEVCAMLCLTYAPTSVRQNKKSDKKHNKVIYKYHIVSNESDKQNKLATIYIDSKQEYKVRLFHKGLRAHEAEVVEFSNLDELRQRLAKFVANF